MPAATMWTNNDVAMLFWRYEKPLNDCLGFAIYREEGTVPSRGKGECLPAWVGFRGENNPSWTQSTTEKWPVQRFAWKDLTAGRGKSYGYRIVPMTGAPDNLTPDHDHALTC